MPPLPSGRLEFTDCHGCGKRVATIATICRHCNTKRNVSSLVKRNPGPRDLVGTADLDAEPDAYSHSALALGGYGEDDYDDAAEEKEQPSIGVFSKMQSFWWYVALVLLVFFVVTALLPQFW
ncbi:MAG: hypothetical protein NTY15_19195 [Planctomycetota bacterium]|nr:hypothetical protein [Planctomycetota bacterium]